MLKSVTIKNFQSHKNTEVEFVPGVNVIIGASDSGKSAFLRSLVWVAKNRPSGDDIVNNDCKEGESVDVILQTEDGIIVEKHRTDGKSSYVLNGKKFEAFKQDVPSEILDDLNLSNINIQMQHDPYFLLSDSPGEVARKLNELTGLDVIDRLFKFINGKILTAKRDMEDEADCCRDYTIQIKSLDYLDDMERDLDEFEKFVKEREEKIEKFNSVRNILNNIMELDISILESNTIVNASTEVEGLLKCCSEYVNKSNQGKSISSILLNIKAVDEKMQSETEWLTVEKEYLFLIGMISKHLPLVDKLKVANSFIKEVKDIDVNIVTTEKSLKKLNLEYVALWKKHKICPLCMTKVDIKTIERILL